VYAIIQDSGTQIKVSQGDVIKVALRDLPEDAATIEFDQVLMVGSASSTPEGDGQDQVATAVQIGQPLVEGAKVTADILAQEKTPRVPVVKFKRRKTYLRRKSHRQDYLKVKITAIDV